MAANGVGGLKGFGRNRRGDQGGSSAELASYPGLSRRGFVVAGLAATGTAMFLSACDSDGSQPQPGADGGSTPTTGGTLTVGWLGAGTAELIIPSGDSGADILRSRQLYNTLFEVTADLKTGPGLATGIEPNDSADSWVITLRDDVVWHNGKPFGADDVVYTIQSWADPESKTYGVFNDVIDYKRVRSRGRLTVEVPLLQSSGQFDSLLAFAPYVAMVPAGVKTAELAQNPIGTGPFKFKSFTPGKQSVFSRNADYWEDAKPYVDEVIIDTSFVDPEAAYNALLSGQLDLMGQLPPLLAQQQETTQQINVVKTPSNNGRHFYMNITDPAFSDVRVRKAMRLVLDRQAIVDNVLLGYGSASNDLWGAGLPYFAEDLEISQDIDQAKSLLKAAGQEGFTTTLTTTDGASPGSVAAATLFAQQAKAAGITINVNKIPASDAYSSSAGYPYDFGASSTGGRASLSAFYQNLFLQYNETRWDTANDDALQAALSEADEARAAELWAEAQQEQFDEGGHIIWGRPDYIDGAAKNVHMDANPAGPLSGYRLQDVWKI